MAISNLKPMSDMPQVRKLTVGEYKSAARSLAEAFLKDNVGRYFIDTPERAKWSEEQKWNLHLSIFEYVTYAHILKGLCTTIGDDYACVALWMPPKAHMDDLWTLFRSGLWRLYYKLCTEGRYRFFTEFFPLLHHTKLDLLGARDQDSYYLVYLGTREGARGKGFARKLMAETLAQADREGKAAYLESSNVANLGFYGRMGFETCRRITMERGEKAVDLDIMIREPQKLPAAEKKGLPTRAIVKTAMLKEGTEVREKHL